MPEDKATTILVFTDGACLGNPGTGGWAARIKIPDSNWKSLSGAERQTTNNRMELTAAVKALEALESLEAIEDIEQSDQPVALHSDSQYLVKGMNLWLSAWQKSNWKTAAKKPVRNKDLWRSLARLAERRKGLRFLWVKGHDGQRENEMTDLLAKQAAEAEKARASTEDRS